MALEGDKADESPDAEIPPVLILPPAIERELDESDDALGSLGRPFDHRAPFFIGLNAALARAMMWSRASFFVTEIRHSSKEPDP